MLTHKPEGSSNPSITHQAVNKLVLISNQLSHPFDYQKYFKLESILHMNRDKNREKSIRQKYGLPEILKSLYDLRSNEAHGSENDFNGKLVYLVSKDQAQEFLEHDVIPKLIQFALEKPRLLLDLKAC